MNEFLLELLATWTRVAHRAPWRVGMGGVALAVIALLMLGGALRARLETQAQKVASGPIFALSGAFVLALSLLWWLADAALHALGVRLIEEHLVLLLASEERARSALLVSEGDGLFPPGVVALPIALFFATIVYMAIVFWVGRTLAELTALEQKPDDVLARERAEQRKAIAQALKEGKPMPVAEVVSLPLADDRFGRIFKLLGHWTSVELVEERFVRWNRPLVGALTVLLVLSLPAALGGHVAAAVWAGAAIAIDGLRRNLRTPPAAPKEAPATPEAAASAPARPAVAPVIEAIHRDAGPLATGSFGSGPAGAQISPGTDLKAKRILEELRRELGLGEGLYVHQGLACDAFAARRNVLLTTPPLSGRETLLDLLVFYALLVEAENVLYLAPDAASARRAEERFRARAEAARWRWNVNAVNVCGRSGTVDLARAQPGLVFADLAAVHRELCARQGDWAPYLAGLGLVVIPDLDVHHGAAGAHLAHVIRRLRRAVRAASPEVGQAGDGAGDAAGAGERTRFAATAAPLFRDLGRFAERLAGRPFLVLGPEVDGAPHAAQTSYFLPATPASGHVDRHPAVHALGEALAHGLSAELFGYEEVLSAGDVARANEVMLGRGIATRGRGFAGSGGGGGGSHGAGGAGDAGGSRGEEAALAEAQVFVVRASAARYAALPLIVSHLGSRAVPVPAARVAALGAGEHVGKGAAPVPPPPPPVEEGAPGVAANGPPPAPDFNDLDNKVVVLCQPDREPFAELLAHERAQPSHPDLRLGCALVADPLAASIERSHLRCTLAEAEVKMSELERQFSQAVLEGELAALRSAKGTRLVESTRREIDRASGALRDVARVKLAGAADVHGTVALDASGAAARIVDRHTGELLFAVEEERALSAAYPGRIFVRGGRRFAVMPIEAQDRLAEGRIACEREERSLATSKIRRLSIERIERRKTADRRAADERVASGAIGMSGAGVASFASGAPATADDARTRQRRADPVRTLGGAPFTLEHPRVHVVDEVLGLRRHGPDGVERDASMYGEPIVCRYATRAAVMGLPRASFGEVPPDALHALAHLFRVTLPAFVHHREEDLEVEWLARFGDAGDPAIVFVDAHAGGVGFAEAVTTEVLRQVARWSLALTRRCPGRCQERGGCPRCVRIAQCHAEPGDRGLDKAGAERVLALLVEPKDAGGIESPGI